jgi:putative ABC transport system ATP-binding protein
MIELLGVSKRYDTGPGRQLVAADDISFSIQPGEFVALTGASGTGKTTLLNIIGAIDRPDAGTVRRDGVDVTALRGAAADRYRRTVGFVFQHCMLLPSLTALDNVIAPVLPFRTKWNKRDRAVDLLNAVGMTGRESALPSQLSGGERQRVAIARALINTPALLLADEPTGNVDKASANGILDLLTGLRIEHTMTVLLASHDPQVAARCDRLIRLSGGRVADDIQLTGGESPADILRRISQLGQLG